MSTDPFEDMEDNILLNQHVLTEDYQPEVILERDEEIDDYRFSLRHVLNGRQPENIMLYGKAGLGKTAVTKYMMDALQAKVAENDDIDDLHVHQKNCNGQSLFMVVRSLVNDLLPEHASTFPKRGLGTGDAFEELYTQLDRIGGTHYLIFDEIDHLDRVNTLLYELPRARSNNRITNCHIGVVGISNKYTFRKSLSAKVKDTLMETEISFSPYDAHELRTILRDRADRAFVDGGCADSAIKMAAAVSASDMGNARQAIDLLRMGAEVAERNGDPCITDDHIDEARELVQRGRLKNRIRDQTQHAQLILEAIARLQTQGKAPVRSKVIKRQYESVANSWNHDPLTTLKSIQDHLSELHMLGFLSRRDNNQGVSGGQYYEYELDMEPEIIISTRTEIEANEV
jgi:orc1/cdc6 family replication initiation protein